MFIIILSVKARVSFEGAFFPVSILSAFFIVFLLKIPYVDTAFYVRNPKFPNFTSFSHGHSVRITQKNYILDFLTNCHLLMNCNPSSSLNRVYNAYNILQRDFF